MLSEKYQLKLQVRCRLQWGLMFWKLFLSQTYLSADDVVFIKEHVKKTEDVVKLGDEILVKCLGYDKKGRLNFSRKDALN